MKTKKSKWIACLTACVLTMSPVNIMPTTPIFADTTDTATMEAANALITTVSSSYELQQKIDNNLSPSCQEAISVNKPSSVYKLTVSEDGLLVMKLFSNYTNLSYGHHHKIHVYSNSGLTNEILSFTADDCSGAVKVTKGDYYFQITSTYDYTSEATVTAYAGLVPTSVEAKEGLATTITTVDNLQTKIDAGLETCFTDVSVSINEPTSIYKITIPSDGWLVFNYNVKNVSYLNLAWLNVYSNSGRTNKLLSINAEDKIGAVYVEAGTYYCQAGTSSSLKNVTHNVYAGFIPSSSKVAVESITLNKDKASAVIKYSAFVDYSTLRTVNEDVHYTKYGDNTTWDIDHTTNCAVNEKFTVTSNGTYTARICPTATNEQFAYLIKFSVSGINEKKPATPKIKTYKKNTSVVKGTAPAYMKVYVKIGNKTYKGTVSKNGTYSVKTCKLKKKQTISVYVKNSAGSVSKTKKVKVKS